MNTARLVHVTCATLAAAALAACSGGPMRMLPVDGGAAPSIAHGWGAATVVHALEPHAAKITLSPTSLAILSTGTISAQTVKVTETGYTGTFTEKSTCAKIASASPASGKGPTLSVKVSGLGAGSCDITFSDSAKNSAKLPITVTTTSFKLTSASISPGSKSITMTLATVNGKAPPSTIEKTVTVALPKCTSSCTIAGPQTPAGTDVFTLTIFDAASGKGNALATVSTSVKVVAGKANLSSPTLAKIPKSFAFGSVPSATAGTAFSSPKTLPLTIKDADGNAIVGTYSASVNVTDSDTSSIAQGSSLAVNGGTAAHAVALTASTNTLTLNYKGLVIAAVTLAAGATGATSSQTSFTPSLPAIQYTGPTVSDDPEIDLYNPTSGQPGYSAGFSDTQAGWKDGTFSNNFTYALGGASNNCSSYVVTPNSGTAAAYTVQVGLTPVVGTCTLTVTGGGGLTSAVLLTYTTTGVGINLRHAKPQSKP
jgi:hypothetical protein